MRCEANRENGRTGGRPKKNQTDIEETEKSERLFSKPKKADKDKDMDMDKEMDKGKEMHKDNINTLCSEPDKPTQNPSGILLLLNDKSSYDVPLDKISTWQQAYPAVNVEQELQKMRAWLESNPSRRKTRKGIDRFINNWLSREQDKGGIYRDTQQEKDRLATEAALARHRISVDPPDCPDGPFQ